MGRIRKNHSGTINWIKCDSCDCWELFDNAHLGVAFDDKSLEDMIFTCRFCVMTDRLNTLSKDHGEIKATLVRLNKSNDELSKRGIQTEKRTQSDLEERKK